jgi:PAS domain-containing protein
MSNELYKKMIEEIRSLRQRLACSEEEMTSLEHSERRYRHFSEKSPTMIYELDSRGYFVNINKAGVKMLGYQQSSEVVGKKFDEFFFATRSANRHGTRSRYLHAA